MAMLTFQDLKDSGISARVNLCADDPRFLQMANRVVMWLLSFGSWYGTTRRAQFCVDENCFTLPGCVATLEGVYDCCAARAIKNQFYQFIEGSTPHGSCGAPLTYQAYGTLPTARAMCAGGIIRSFVSSPLDLGKTITFYGHDLNRIWVRTLRNGVMQDGETVTLNTPWADTVTVFGDVTAVQKQVTNERITVFHHPSGDSTLEPLAVYEYWETRPDYQRFQLLNSCTTAGIPCYGTSLTGTGCTRRVIEAIVKLEYMPMRHDSDYVLVANLAALELALEALKAKDDGDIGKADVLMFGNGQGKRLGAVPLLQQELRTMTSDRFTGRVNIHRAAPFRRVMAGFN